jgi:hypothetical protein
MTYPRRAERVCRRLAAGESLEAICAHEDMPTLETVRGWMLDSPDFHARYLRAKQILAERLTEEVVAIADNLGEGASEAETRRQRLRIEARKWTVSRLAERPFAREAEIPTAGQAPVLVEFSFGDDAAGA